MSDCPDFWSHLTDDSTQAEINAADAAFDAWRNTPEGLKWMAECHAEDCPEPTHIGNGMGEII